MNKFESKYFNTAQLMNQALIELLNKKEYEYITIKEICKKAGVNRSTFYLHYENMNDLLEETVENINKKFLSYFNHSSTDFIKKIEHADINDLILITPEYLLPFLNFIKENKTIYQVAIKHPTKMQSSQKFTLLNKYILFPIFNRFHIDERQNKYLAAYYINGINAIVNEWINTNCKDDIDYICNIIVSCIRPYK